MYDIVIVQPLTAHLLSCVTKTDPSEFSGKLFMFYCWTTADNIVMLAVRPDGDCKDIYQQTSTN